MVDFISETQYKVRFDDGEGCPEILPIHRSNVATLMNDRVAADPAAANGRVGGGACAGAGVSTGELHERTSRSGRKVVPVQSKGALDGFVIVLAMKEKKTEWEKRVEALEGTVAELDFDSFQASHTVQPGRYILLADGPRRNKAYLKARCFGVPCISTEWLEECERANRLVKLDKRHEIERGPADVPKGKTIGLYDPKDPEKSRTLVNFLTDALTIKARNAIISGRTLKAKIQTAGKHTGIDLIIVPRDTEVSQVPILRTAGKRGIRVMPYQKVLTEWKISSGQSPSTVLSP